MGMERFRGSTWRGFSGRHGSVFNECLKKPRFRHDVMSCRCTNEAAVTMPKQPAIPCLGDVMNKESDASSDPMAEEARAIMKRCAGQQASSPNETAILHLRCLPERRGLTQAISPRRTPALG